MIETTFKYVKYGELFDFEGRTYKKTNHMRGVYYNINQRSFKNFNKRSKVTAHKDFYDIS